MTISAPIRRPPARDTAPSWVVAAAVAGLVAAGTFVVPELALVLSTEAGPASVVAPSPSPQAAPTPPHE